MDPKVHPSEPNASPNQGGYGPGLAGERITRRPGLMTAPLLRRLRTTGGGEPPVPQTYSDIR